MFSAHPEERVQRLSTILRFIAVQSTADAHRVLFLFSLQPFQRTSVEVAAGEE